MNWRSACSVRVTAEQEPMVADHQPVVLVIMAKSLVSERGLRWEPMAYQLTDGTFGAVFGLGYGDNDAQLFNFAVSKDLQRTGVGTAALEAVIAHLGERGVARFSLTVHPNNEPAQALYEKVGMTRSGEMVNDEPVFELSL